VSVFLRDTPERVEASAPGQGIGVLRALGSKPVPAGAAAGNAETYLVLRRDTPVQKQKPPRRRAESRSG